MNERQKIVGSTPSPFPIKARLGGYEPGDGPTAPRNGDFHPLLHLIQQSAQLVLRLRGADLRHFVNHLAI